MNSIVADQTRPRLDRLSSADNQIVRLKPAAWASRKNPRRSTCGNLWPATTATSDGGRSPAEVRRLQGWPPPVEQKPQARARRRNGG